MLWALTLSSSAGNVSFNILKQQDQCIQSDLIPATTGGQYVDPGNGVPDNSWSILKRWQDPLPLRDSFFQCIGGEIHINTWHVKHNPILGGGFNDMAGYSWDLASAPKAFVDESNHPADLIVQGYISQTQTLIHLGTNRPLGTPEPAFQVSLFAYLLDQSHPQLHPIAVIGLYSDNRPLGTFCGASGLNDYPAGVWFWAFFLDCASSFNVNDPFGDETLSIPAQYWAAQTPLTLIRMRVSPQNLTNAIRVINQSACANCPQSGYSNNPQDYVVKYAGLIAEASLLDSQDGSLGDSARDQISVGLNWLFLGIYRRVETP